MLRNQMGCFLLALLLVCPIWGLAAEGDSFATYVMPEGAETLFVTDISQFEAPQGMETMYAAMGRVTSKGDIYIIRMKNGLALASVSCRTLSRSLTAEELLALTPQILNRLQQEFETVDPSSVTVEVNRQFENPALCVSLTVSPGADGPSFSLQGAAFSQGMEMMEVWSIMPTDDTLPGLANDRSDMEALLSSLHFGETDDSVSASSIDGLLTAVALPDSQPYADPDGAFTVQLPTGSLILTPHSTQEERSSIRQQYIAAHSEGADRLFDSVMGDIDDENATVVFSPDFQAIIEFFCEDAPFFQGYTPRQFFSIAPGIASSLNEKFDHAMCLESDKTLTLSGLEHAILSFWMRDGEMNLRLDAVAAVEGDSTLREIDLLMPVQADSAAQRDRLLALLMQTLQYISAP